MPADRCECGAAIPTTSRERRRFARRHGTPCPQLARRERIRRGTLENARETNCVVPEDDAPDVPELRPRREL